MYEDVCVPYAHTDRDAHEAKSSLRFVFEAKYSGDRIRRVEVAFRSSTEWLHFWSIIILVLTSLFCLQPQVPPTPPTFSYTSSAEPGISAILPLYTPSSPSAILPDRQLPERKRYVRSETCVCTWLSYSAQTHAVGSVIIPPPWPAMRAPGPTEASGMGGGGVAVLHTCEKGSENVNNVRNDSGRELTLAEGGLIFFK